MHFRKHVLEESKAITNDATTKIDMEGSGILNNLQLWFRAKADTDIIGAGMQRIIDYLDAITLVGNGDEEIISLTGEEALALAFYDNKELPYSMTSIYGSKTHTQSVPLNFGRFYQDPEMGLKIDRYKTLKLELTFADFDPQFLSTGTSCRVTQEFMEGLGSEPRHYLRKIELEKDKPSADGQYVKYKVPDGLKLRRLLFLLDPDLTVATSAPTAYPTGDSYNLTLGLKSEGTKLLDKFRPKDLFFENARKYGQIVNAWRQGLNTSIYIDTQLGYVQSIASGAVEEGTGADSTPPSFEDSNDRFQRPKFAGNAEHYGLVAVGYGYLSSFVQDFDHGSIDEYLDTSRYDPVTVKWYGHADDHRFRMVKDELMTN